MCHCNASALGAKAPRLNSRLRQRFLCVIFYFVNVVFYFLLKVCGPQIWQRQVKHVPRLLCLIHAHTHVHDVIVWTGQVVW